MIGVRAQWNFIGKENNGFPQVQQLTLVSN